MNIGEVFVRNKRKIIALLGAAAGILLILFGGSLTKTGGNGSGNPGAEDHYFEVSFYTDTLEKKIETLCMSVSGISEAQVLLTLDCGTEYVYAQNGQQSESGSTSTDYLILNRGEDSEPVMLVEIYPKIRGIAVVCTGGDDGTVQQTVVDLLSAAFGISTNRIKVAGS